MNRPPWTKDFTCSVHKRSGDHPEEASCAAHLFVAAGDAPAEEKFRSSSSSPAMPWGAGPPPDRSSFTPYGPAATAPGPFTAKAGLGARKYRFREAPAEVSAVAEGDVMLASAENGPAFAIPRDMFFTFFEAVDPEDLPETEGALAKAPQLPHDVAKTALLEPGQSGGQAAPAPSPDDHEDTEN